MTIAQEEIFGPVLSIMPYDDEEDAVRIANDTDLRPRRRRLVGGRGARQAGGRAHPHRAGRDQRRRLQPAGAVRRLQAVGPRPRARPLRPRGVPRGEVAAALRDGARPEAVGSAAAQGELYSRVRLSAVRRPAPGRAWRWASRPTFFSTKADAHADRSHSRATSSSDSPPPSRRSSCSRASRSGRSGCGSFIDHPDGVSPRAVRARDASTCATCSRTTGSRSPRRARSGRSPSRTTSGASSAAARACACASRATATGASPGSSSARPTTEVTVAADDGVVSIPYSEINRSNLLEGEG